ncbi:flagellar motor protein MotB [Vibrio breoganii]
MTREKRPPVNYLVMASDVMSGLLFVFVILIVIMSLSYKQKIDEYKKITMFQKENKEILNDLLKNIDKQMKKSDIYAEIDYKNGIIRLNNKSLNFSAGSHTLSGQYRENLIKISKIFNDTIPCYSSTPPNNMRCNERVKGTLNLVFIEGHTDNVPLGRKLAKKYNDNLELSTRRANFTYRLMTEEYSLLGEIMNNDQYPLFSVSGYGENRPVPGHSYSYIKEDVANRRIDIRFLMAIPTLNKEEVN